MVNKSSRVVIKKNEFRKLAKLTPQEAGKVIKALAEEGRTIVVESIEDSPADGRQYARGTRTHTASSPGNPPRTDSGTLKNSIQVERVRKFSQRIVTEVEYAVPLEFGVPERGLEARPFFGPMAMELEGLIPDFFDAFLEDKV